MNKNSTLENLYKNNLNGTTSAHNEALWTKLDAQLVPIRNQYASKQRKKRIAYWVLPSVSIITVAVMYMINNDQAQYAKHSNSKPHSTAQNNINTITNIDDNINQTKAIDVNTLPQPIVHSNNTQLPDVQHNAVSSLKSTPNNQSITATQRHMQVSNSVSNNTQPSTYTYQELSSNGTANHASISLEAQRTSVAITSPTMATLGTVNLAALKLPYLHTPHTQKQHATAKSANTKSINGLSALAGVTVATPISKPSYVIGAMATKSMKDATLFAGVKVAQNQLDHQLVSTAKANTFPQVTDALIQKLTTIQVPFGYEFVMQKKSKHKSSILVGFEPTLLTGVRTLYYDDNGVPGGPRTMVVNSPLLNKAVNKFNVSFIAGIKTALTHHVGFTLNAGYGLIDITDKQYYNRTTQNNNLKYIQAGLLFRLK